MGVGRGVLGRVGVCGEVWGREETCGRHVGACCGGGWEGAWGDGKDVRGRLRACGSVGERVQAFGELGRVWACWALGACGGRLGSCGGVWGHEGRVRACWGALGHVGRVWACGGMGRREVMWGAMARRGGARWGVWEWCGAVPGVWRRVRVYGNMGGQGGQRGEEWKTAASCCARQP